MNSKPLSLKKDAAIRQLNAQPERVLISLVRSQTMDVFASTLSPELQERLTDIRRTSPDGTKTSVERIEAIKGGYRVFIDGASREVVTITEEDAGPFHFSYGGGLCNLSKDLEVILDVIARRRESTPPLAYLTWSDAQDAFPGRVVDGSSRKSLILRAEGFPKLILTERGPSYDAFSVDPWAAEQEFYGSGNDLIVIGQEPVDTEKFNYILKRKLKDPGLRVFWLVGGNQLRKLYTEFRRFLSIVDVVSLNLAEAAKLFAFEPLQNKHKNASELHIMYAREISRRVLDYGAKYVVITDGAKGASLARKSRGGHVEFVYSPLIQEKSIEVDRSVHEDTGCGDSFASAIAAYYITRGDSFKLNEAANFAHYVAGIIYQRPRPHLTDDDKVFVGIAHDRAKRSGVFVGKHEMFWRSQCQIRPTRVSHKGPRGNVLICIYGDDPSNPEQPPVTGAGLAVENLARMCQDGTYAMASLVHVVPRITINPAGRGGISMQVMEPETFALRAERGDFCLEVGDLESPRSRNGVLREHLVGKEGLYVLRTTLLEVLEILSSEDFAELFGDIKYWHFATEDVDERIVWHTKTRGVSREQSEVIIRQALRENMARALGPNVRFAKAQSTNLNEFEREMTEDLVLRLDELLTGVFRTR